MAYIEREAYSKALKDLISDSDGRTNYEKGYIRGLATANGMLLDENQTPAADVVVVRHGKWIMRGGRFRCSECDGKALMQDVGGTGGFSREFEQVKSDICPHCGAKMDGKDGE